ncbi:MAG: IS982 family transposase, partial [Prevotella sp.]
MDEGYKRMRNRKGQMSKSEIMTILLCYHFGSFRNFKHYYLF